ncbi:MAG: response regulator, partial [Planctomycetes bacterium]|nr:response regulator [Planctomycetota bacterium]
MGESEDWAVCSLASASAREVECPDAVCSQARNEVKCRDASFASLSASGGSLGSLRASNEPNPLNAPNAPNPLNQPHPAPRALIVDDEPDPREVLSRALMAEGYSCATAETAAEALAEIGKAAFDAIVIDYRLPGMNGLELLERVRALRPETATVVITGFGSEETTRKAFLLGADDYLAKPIKLPEFIECVRRAIEKRKAATSRDQVTGVRCQEGDAGQGNRSAIPT